MCGRSWSVWAGVRNGPQDGHGSATKSRSGTGRRRCGPRLKKSPSRRAHPRLHRRKRTEPTAASLPHLGAARANAGFAVQLQLEESVGGRRANRVELLLSPVSRCREEGASAGLSASPGTTPASAAAGGVGPFAGAPQSTGSGLHRQSARLDSPRIPPSLRAGTEPRGIHLGSLEATRTAERLPQGLLPTQRSRAPHFAPHAPPPPTDHRLLAASFFVAGMTLYYARVNSAEDIKKIERGLKRGPEDLGYESSLWTAYRVAHLVEHECEVRYRPGHAWRILRQLGWSCQRPVGRALERDEKAIRRWKKQRWPEIKKSPKRGPDHRLHRRKRIKRETPSLSHLGSAGANAAVAVPLDRKSTRLNSSHSSI